MPNFRYIAKNMSSKTVRGTIEAADSSLFIKKLKDMDLFLISYQTVSKEEEPAARLKTQELADFSRQIAAMLSSGIPLIQSVGIIMQRDCPPKILKIYQKLYSQLQNGVPLSEAMENQGSVFPEFMINMIHAGESSGNLDQYILKIALHYEKEHKTNNKIKTALTYPMFLACVCVGVVILLFTAVLPNFFTLFSGIELPVATRILMSISKFMMNHWIWVVIGFLSLVALISFLLKIPSVYYQIDRYKLKLPKIGKLLKIIYTSRFSHTLSSMYLSGLSMVRALEITAIVIGNSYISRQITQSISSIRNGIPLSECIKGIDGFDSKLSSAVYIGEESGRLDTMLDSISDSFDYDADQAIAKLTTFIEPAMIIFMALIVGFIMISVMMPIYSLYQNVS